MAEASSNLTNFLEFDESGDESLVHPDLKCVSILSSMLNDSEFNQDDFEESESESDFKANPDVDQVDESTLLMCDFTSLIE